MVYSPYDSLQRVYCLQALCGNLKGHHYALCHGHASLAGSNPEIFMQVMSLVTCSSLLEHPKVGELYPADAIARAKQCLTYFSGGLGAYTDSR